MNKLQQSVVDYNAMYGTSFSVVDTFSLTKDSELPQLNDLDTFAGKGGVFLFYDAQHDLVAVYSTKDFSGGLRSHIKSERDSSGNWAIKGVWDKIPAFVAFIIGDQNKMYEKDSLRTYLISVLNPYYDEYGVISR